MSEIETTNAIIKRTELGKEDHGIFTFFLHLDYGHSGQGAGGYSLSQSIDGEDWFVPSFGGLINEILNTVGVENWEDLPGKHIRVRYDRSKVHEIGHFLDDRWLNFRNFFDLYQTKLPAPTGD